MCNKNAKTKYFIFNQVKFKKINREIKILMALNGQENAIKLLDIVKYIFSITLDKETYIALFSNI